jgi:hypothetical protein
MRYPFDPGEMPDDETMEQIGGFLRRWTAPEVDPLAKSRLIERLMHVPMVSPVPVRPPLKMSLLWIGLIFRSQVRLINVLSWAASAILLALGTLVTFLSFQTPNGTTLPIILVAPVVAAVGVAFLYGEDVDPPLEVQMTTPVSPRVILLARLALLYGFNLVLAMACSILLAATQAQISLAPLVLSWLAPMTFLSALAFLLSVFLFDTTLSIIVSLMVWFGLVWRHFADASLMPYATYLPDLLAVDFRPVLFLSALLLVGIALWLSERESLLNKPNS